MRKTNLALCLFLAVTTAFAQTHQPVLLISVDGLRPDYVTQADAHHLRIPNLRRIMAQGTYADGVMAAFPTVTYPNHTTLVTGVWPAEHGVLNNQRFDPERKLYKAWYWYADDIKVATLWSAAQSGGLHTASVSWPATADSTSIDYLIPEYWRTASAGEPFNPDDRFLLNAVSRPDGEVAGIAERTGTPYMMGNDTTIDGDEVRTRYSLDILKQHRPEFMTIHLSSLDEEQHHNGPFSDEANSDLESIDGMIGRLVAQERTNYANAAVVIVSDHGFAKLEHSVNLYIPFLDAGLIQVEKTAAGTLKVKSWQAEPWLAGCTTPIMIHDPADTASRDKAMALVQRLAADPANGIEAVLDHTQLVAAGAFPDAAFAVTLKRGYCNGELVSGPLVTDSTDKGAHGYNPATTPEMHSSFFAEGPGIARGKDLGLIDMRRIAPTLAGILGVSLPAAKQPALPLR